MASIRTLIIFGTRPEAIKLAPVICESRQRTTLEPLVCCTGQHVELLTDVVEYFGLAPDFSLDIMRPGISMAKKTAGCLEKLDSVIDKTMPVCIVAQGDTLSVLAASLAAFFRSIPFVHVEAGLRTGDFNSPWPEEFNRRVTSLATSIHCAPTAAAANNLLAENIDPSTIHVTGNTVVDALLWTINQERSRQAHWENKYPQLTNRRVVLITSHRRENMGKNFEAMCAAIQQLSELFPDTIFVYPVHLNPKIRNAAYQFLDNRSNIVLLDPLSYPEFIWMMSRAEIILTDSGGIQEEAPTLKKQVLLMRDTSERPEAIQAGFTTIVGCETDSIIRHTHNFLNGQSNHAWSTQENPYGDGTSAKRICDLLESIPG